MISTIFPKRTPLLLLVITTALIVLAACGRNRTPEPTPTVAPTEVPTVAPTATPVPPPTATPVPVRSSNCDPSYPTVCIPPSPPDLDCGEIPYRRFQVRPPDPHRFDGDHDGIGCER